MVDPFISGLIVAFLGALAGAVAMQGLVYWRRKRERRDELKYILKWIKHIEEEGDLSVLLEDESYLWSLRNDLYEAYRVTRSDMNKEARVETQKLLDAFYGVDPKRGNAQLKGLEGRASQVLEMMGVDTNGETKGVPTRGSEKEREEQEVE